VQNLEGIMNETQKTISDWGLETFGKAQDRAILIGRTAQEMIEALQLVLPSDVGVRLDAATRVAIRDVRESPLDEEYIREEAADVLIVLYQVATAYGFDLHAEVDRKMEINRNRKWKVDKDGVGQHL